MININLKKSQVPSEIDIPRKYKKPKIVVFIGIIIGITIVILAVSVYLLKSITEKPIPTTHIATHKEKPIHKEEIKKQEIKLKHKPAIKHQQITKKEKTTKKQTKVSVKEIQEKQQEAIFKISLNFENLPKRSSIKQKEAYTPPLPPQLKPKEKPKKKTEQSKSVIYEITVKTTRMDRLKSILNSFGISEFKVSSKPVSTIKLYDVYVGGFYSYPKILEFAKVLKKKGYKVYAIKNINLLYFALIDKNIDKTKKIAYAKAWSKTPFKLYFKPKRKTKLIYTVKFASPNTQLIKTLKKSGFYPIIKPIKNGA
ncbi:hypothetical protein [Hippea alviniae]|uniref:hypothetical protein n=1 Tax=Hippea alviniae TaxID=1279027 RepID=UPI000412609F|nr:hypothetical protein [Hippea alviniae]